MSAVDPVSERRVRGLRLRLIGLMSVVAFADFVFGAAYVGLLLDLGFTATGIGTVLMVSGIINTVSEAPSGALGDRFGQRKLLVLGLLLWGTALVVFGASHAPALIVASLLLWGLGMACYAGAPYALVVNELKRAGADKRMGSVLRSAQVVRWLASAAGALSVFLVGDLATPWVIAACGLLLLLSALVVRLTWPESPASAHGVRTILTAGLASFPHSRPLQTVTVYSVLVSMVFGVTVLAWQPLLLAEGWRLNALGLALFVFTLASAAGSYLARFTEVRPRAGVVLLAAGCAVCLALAGTGVWPLVSLAVAQLLLGTALSTMAVWSHEVFDDGLRNTQGSLVAVAGGLAMAIVDWAFGLTWDGLGVHAALTWWAVGLIILVLVVEAVQRLVPARGPARSAPVHVPDRGDDD